MLNCVLFTLVEMLTIALAICLDRMTLSRRHFGKVTTCGMQRDRHLLLELSLKFDVRGKRRGVR